MKRAGKFSKSIASFFRHVFEYPGIRSWISKHPRLTGQVQKRLSPRKFTGLPLTLLGAAFLYVLALLLGIVQDYLSHDPLIAVDIRVANLLYAFRGDQLLHFFYTVTLLAEFGTVVASAVVLTIFLWLRKEKILAAALWLTLLPAEAVTYFGKLLFHRGRPDILLRAISEDSFSFPSGHATASAAFFGFIAYLLIRRFKSWTARIATALVAAIMIILIDVSRLYLGVHYLSDVLAGNMVGIAALLFAVTVVEWLIAEKKVARPKAFGWLSFSSVILTEVLAVVVFLRVAPLPSSKPIERPTQSIAVSDILPLFQAGTLPQYTETLTGKTQEPVNLIVVAPDTCFTNDLDQAGWVQADVISLQSTKSISTAALLNKEYPTAPMTPSFYDSWPHDYGFEKETVKKTVRSRHHARFWKTSYVTSQGTLYVGTVSLDTGLKWGITHTIAPDIDTERDLLVSDLQSAGVVKSEELIPLIQPKLGSNFFGDLFFTDGKAAFVILDTCGS